MHRTLRIPAALAALIVVCVPLRAQDVELWGRLHGTRPPDAYYERVRQDPDAFQFRRAWRGRTGFGSVDGGVGTGAGTGDVPGVLNGRTHVVAASATGLGPRDAPVQGTFAFPVLPGSFEDGGEPAYTSAEIQREFFDGPATGLRKTISQYYAEISRGNVDLVGETFDWTRATMERGEVTGASKGLGDDAEVGEFILELLRAADDGSVDWGRFDNDGADGLPNSGDDDGFVDVLAVMHPTEGGECQTRGNIIWSHRWRLTAATDSTSSDPDPGAGRPYETSSPAAGGGNIRVDDYVIVPLLECEWEDEGSNDLSHIGVFAHELGHGFGLPDLYGTGTSSHSGAGNWDLMATGSWGCDPVEPTPHMPCHPGAWTKVAMGWVEVDTIPAGSPLSEITLGPVETSGRVALVEANDGSGEYFLLENRRREGFDQLLPAEGLLVWHVDPGVLGARWSGNRVNADPDHPGVWLRQADGLDDLMKQGGGRGDRGDVFTVSGADEFHAGTVPSAFTHAGNASGLTATNLREGFGGVLTLDVENRYHTVTLQSDGGGAGTEFLVDGAAVSAEPSAFESAPFQPHVIEAPPGATIEEGVREGFQGWEDGSSRIRDFVSTRSDTTLTASYGGREVHFDVALVSPSSSVAPGTVSLEPGTEDGWVPEGADVRVEAEARTGFDFLEWGGAFEGRTNPFFLSAAGPLDAEARFDLVYSVASNPTRVELVAATEEEIVLQVANGNEPVTWSVTRGRLPEGLILRSDGGMAGAPLEDGVFPLVLTARDAIGLEADLAVDLEIAPPPVGLASLASPLLGGATGLTGLQEAYLDRGGNGNARYDVGDFRAFLQDHPDTPDVAASPASDGDTPVVLPPVVLEKPATSSGGSEGDGSDGSEGSESDGLGDARTGRPSEGGGGS